MDDNRLALQSLASDLKRVALGLHRGSRKMAKRFGEEALKRKKEINTSAVPAYITKLLDQLEDVLHSQDSGRKAEDLLMYSILFQNHSLVRKFGLGPTGEPEPPRYLVRPDKAGVYIKDSTTGARYFRTKSGGWHLLTGEGSPFDEDARITNSDSIAWLNGIVTDALGETPDSSVPEQSPPEE